MKKLLALLFLINCAYSYSSSDDTGPLDCSKFKLNEYSRVMGQLDPVTQQKFMESFESRYQECLKLNKDLGKKYGSKKE